MTKNPKTVSIGVPAHNEEGNISNLLDSIMNQRETNFKLEEIYVVLDGSTDKTKEIVEQKLKNNKKLVLHNDGKRMGKFKRLEQIYKLSNSEVLISFDGDIAFGDNKVFSKLIDQFTDSKIAIVGANAKPVNGSKLFGKLLNSWSYVWYIAKTNYRNGDNVYNCRGCSVALKKDFYKKVNFPNDVFSDSQYLYLEAKSRGLRFVFATEALVYYRKPETVGDYILQIRRSSPERDNLQKYFGSLVKEEYKIPPKYKYIALIKMLIHNPVYTVLGGVLVKLIEFLFRKRKIMGIENKGWETASSTKTPIKL